ncbi:hypothetical protein GCM10011391_23430 [Pullulanibacillus camelliae]|uniref:Uncharacterized protein n=1 Tax=Pullulanibacillus camelliae TaxID=1707096 RepID=A0A8J2YHZ1_9BACL|nr:hypothetical protein [Pullulanibacillus camelliae]GGE43928.1 hypothetical protein GCM10011391_23430 [Pullulanibacillus camelliae]
MKPDVIFDSGGVLVSNFSPHFWHALSATCDVPLESLLLFKKRVRSGLWSGHITENEFWKQLCKLDPKINREKAEALLRQAICPLPPLKKIPKWSTQARLHLLSNHRAEWLSSVLKGVRPYFNSFTISSQVGRYKP